jgi:hypothetical protein
MSPAFFSYNVWLPTLLLAKRPAILVERYCKQNGRIAVISGLATLHAEPHLVVLPGFMKCAMINVL